jgi:hypothetical protein
MDRQPKIADQPTKHPREAYHRQRRTSQQEDYLGAEKDALELVSRRTQQRDQAVGGGSEEHGLRDEQAQRLVLHQQAQRVVVNERVLEH